MLYYFSFRTAVSVSSHVLQVLFMSSSSFLVSLSYNLYMCKMCPVYWVLNCNFLDFIGS
jgi:hypothetical protein